MESKVVSGIMLTLLLVGLLMLAFNIQPAKAEPITIIVPDDYPTIQAAVNVASPGDTIFVRADTYYEHVVVNKTVSLIGENQSITIIDGNETGTVINVEANNVNISEFTIRNGTTGMLLEGLGGNISGNILASNVNDGVYTYMCSNSALYNNIIIDNGWHGIMIGVGTNNSDVTRNVIAENGVGIGSPATGGWLTSGNTISDNNISDNGYGIYLVPAWTGNIIYHNNFINNTYGAYSDIGTSPNVWDDGYPSGGNYWSDHDTVDDYSGVNQDELGSDGIVDEPYIIDSYNRDNYPLVEPWNSVERKVGVKIGDWVKYSNFDVAWNSDDPNSEMQVGIAILSETEWLENSVETILDTKMKYQQLLHFKNGSEIATTCWIDVETASGTLGPFISSGLGQGDCLYDSAPWFAWKINDTISHVYIGVPREVNCLNITTSMHIGPPPAYPNSTGNFYWDKETGVLCELSMKHLNQTGSHVTSWSVFYEIVGTNLWEAPNPAEETQELIETIETWELPKGTENSLTSKLEGALHLLDIENENGVIHKLMAFMNQIEALRGKKLTDVQADYLISEAQRIIGLIEG